MDVCDINIRKEDESFHQALFLRYPKVNVVWNWESLGFVAGDTPPQEVGIWEMAGP